MKLLTRREEMVLLSIWNLRKEAYLLAIKRHLSQVSGKNWSVGAIYVPLSRLEKMGYTETYFGGATATRGGRRKKIYKITESGLKALDEYQKINDILWADYRGLS